MSRELLKRSFDASAFITSNAEAIKVNPKIWDTDLKQAVEEKLVYAKVGVGTEDFRKPGRDLTITIDGKSTSAADLAETDAIAIVAMTNRQVTFTPSERGVGYEVSKSELEDAFFQVMPKMVAKAAAGLAKKIDADGVTCALTNAGNTFNSGEVADTAIDATTLLTFSDFTKARRILQTEDYNPSEVFINEFQEEQVLNIEGIQKADAFGSRSGLVNGFIGRLFGFDIYVSKSIDVEAAAGDITVASSRAIFQGVTDSGEKAVAYAIKRDPMVDLDQDKAYRKYMVYGTARYDFQAMHPDAIVTVRSYTA